MDICCGEVVVKSQIKKQSTASNISNDEGLGNKTASSQSDLNSDFPLILENLELLQSQLDELTSGLSQVSTQVTEKLKAYVDRTIKKEQQTKRY